MCKKDRELALQWWDSAPIQERVLFAKKANFTVWDGDYDSFSTLEIEWIWRNQPWKD